MRVIFTHGLFLGITFIYRRVNSPKSLLRMMDKTVEWSNGSQNVLIALNGASQIIIVFIANFSAQRSLTAWQHSR